MSRIIGVLLLQVFMFYHIYPQALPMFGSSFILTSGILGLGLYIFHNFPYREVVTLLIIYCGLIVICLLTAYINNYEDSYWMDVGKSQIAWASSAYLFIFLFFMYHPEGNIYTIIYYIIGAILLQGIISVAMHLNPEIYNFFDSIHMLDGVTAFKRAETRGERLLGYGVAFFGAGLVYGVALILLVYVIVTRKLNVFQTILASLTYAFIFFVGLLTARTTMIGGTASLILLVVLYIFSKEKRVKQGSIFVILAIVSISIGHTVTYIYFPEFADWAFEVFINYGESGEIRTDSSDAISEMFFLPNDTLTWIIGNGHMAFWGTDVGYTRLLFYIGIIGTFFFFFFQFILMKMAFTKNLSLNLVLLTLFSYNCALNVKGLSDLNAFGYLFLFYFLYYRYYIYAPKMYILQQQNKLQPRPL